MALTTKVGNQHDLVLSCLHIQDAAMNYSKIRLDNTMPYRKCREPKQQPSNARSVSPVPWFLSVSRATSFTFCTLVRERNTPWIEVRVHSSTASEEWNYVTRGGRGAYEIAEEEKEGRKEARWLLRLGKLPVLALDGGMRERLTDRSLQQTRKGKNKSGNNWNFWRDIRMVARKSGVNI